MNEKVTSNNDFLCKKIKELKIILENHEFTKKFSNLIEQDLNDFTSSEGNLMDKSKSVLIVLGEKNSGKTTFINHLIHFNSNSNSAISFNKVIDIKKNSSYGISDFNWYKIKFSEESKEKSLFEKIGKNKKKPVNEFELDDSLKHFYEIVLPLNEFPKIPKYTQIIRLPSVNSKEDANEQKEYIQKKKAFCFFLKSMSSPSAFSQDMCIIFSFLPIQKFMNFIWSKKDYYDKIEPEDIFQAKEEIEEKLDAKSLEEYIRNNKRENLEKRKESLKKKFPCLQDFYEFNLTGKDEDTQKKLSLFFEGVFKTKYDKEFRVEFQKNILINKILQIISDSIKILNEEQINSNSLINKISFELENNEQFDRIQNDSELWDLLEKIEENNKRLTKLLTEKYNLTHKDLSDFLAYEPEEILTKISLKISNRKLKKRINMSESLNLSIKKLQEYENELKGNFIKS